MSRHNRHNRLTQDQGTVVAALDQVEAFFRRDAERMNHLVERTAECVLLLSGYMAYRLDVMRDGIDGNSPFVMKLSNRANAVLRACDDFLKVMEPMIKAGDEYKQAYGQYSDTITQCLDSLFADLHRPDPEPTYEVTRRAKLRYHEPYQAKVRECQAAFEDGYVKGWMDAMTEALKEVARISDSSETMLTVHAENGKLKLTKA